MAKRTKRPINRETKPGIEKPVTDPLTASRTTSFNPDYQFVIKDIRRVGILAGSFFIVLVALALILHL
ncbi:MAG: hypothetical protein C3F13_07500 [Anaerolineales bacterium]|nr:hypothetical protein [Anaerolineae bacterium]PWB54129.1 MAG: hypothetical protein C3F13_07500 [Anaerolineales bacterium]